MSPYQARQVSLTLDWFKYGYVKSNIAFFWALATPIPLTGRETESALLPPAQGATSRLIRRLAP